MDDKLAALMPDNTLLEHMCKLDYEGPVKHRRLTNIICTISKASQDEEILEKMIMSGMSIVRLNCSHDSQDFHKDTIEMTRSAVVKVSEKLGYGLHVAIALDTKGAEIRTGLLENINSVELRKNDTIRLSVNPDTIEKGTRECVYIDYPNAIYVVPPGTKVYMNEGTISLVVKEVGVDCLICTIEVGGTLYAHMGVTLPGIPIELPAVSEKDRFDLKFAIEHRVDIILASKIRTANGIKDIRKTLGDKGKDIKIIAKIENLQGLQNLEEIIVASDGILLARADLAVEIPPEKVFLVQKAVMARCNRAGRPVICGTQLFESMRSNPFPSRPEIADLANSVLDGADCVMLSSETAIGQYPVQAVVEMAKVCHEAEGALWYRDLFSDLIARNPAIIDAAHAVAIAAVDASKKALASAIIVLTTSGKSANLVSKYRPRCPIIAVTRCNRTARQTLLMRGVIPLFYTEPTHEDWLKEIDERVYYALNAAKSMKIVDFGDAVIILSPWKNGGGFTNNMRLIYAFFENAAVNCIFAHKDDEADNNGFTSDIKHRTSN